MGFVIVNQLYYPAKEVILVGEAQMHSRFVSYSV